MNREKRIPVPIGVDKMRNDSTNELVFTYTVSRHMTEMTGFIEAMGREVTANLTEQIIETQLAELAEAVLKRIDKNQIRKTVEDEIAKAAVIAYKATL